MTEVMIILMIMEWEETEGGGNAGRVKNKTTKEKINVDNGDGNEENEGAE